MIWELDKGISLGYQQAALGQPISLKHELTYCSDRHLFTTGPNGSGKTRRLALVNLCRLLNWSIVVVDTKGSLTVMTRKLRKDAGCEEIILNPANLYNLGSVGHNPINLLNPQSDDFVDDVMEHSETIVTIGDTNEPHWPESAQDLVAAVEMYVAAILKGTMADVRALLGQTDTAIRNMIKASPFNYKGVDYPCILQAAVALNLEEMGYKAARFADMASENKELHSIFSTALTQTRSFDSRNLKRDMAGSAVDFTMLKRKPSTVYIVVPPRRLKIYSKWIRLMIASMFQALMQDVKRADVPVLFIFDEWFAIAKGGFPIVEDNYAQVREFGIKMWFMLQDLAQAHILYGQQGFETLIGNAGVFQSFAPQEMVSSRYISEMTGQTTEYSTSGSGQRGFSTGGASINESGGIAEIARPLLLPHEVRELDDGMTVAFGHKWKGTALSYLPYPTELPWLKDVCALDPAA